MSQHLCPWWLAYAFDNFGRRLVQNPDKILAPYVEPGMTVMDLGCGMGFAAIAAARMVGNEGLVLAVDMQQEMLDVLMKRARHAGVDRRIRPHRCKANQIGIDGPVDFAVALWMLHEVPDARRFLGQVCACLKPGGKFLVVEPLFHVSKEAFQGTLETAEASGLEVIDRPRVSLSMAALCRKAGVSPDVESE